MTHNTHPYDKKILFAFNIFKVRLTQVEMKMLLEEDQVFLKIGNGSSKDAEPPHEGQREGEGV